MGNRTVSNYIPDAYVLIPAPVAAREIKLCATLPKQQLLRG